MCCRGEQGHGSCSQAEDFPSRDRDPQRTWGSLSPREEQSLMPCARHAGLILPWGGRGAVVPLLLGQVVLEAAYTERGAAPGWRVSEMTSNCPSWNLA